MKQAKDTNKRIWPASGFAMPKIISTQNSSDGTHKFLIQLGDEKCVETVLLPFHKKYTVCLSTQVGCAMGCTFCYTARQGLARNLNADEIVAQYFLAFEYLKIIRPEHRITPNIVLMGQGEPLHNFDNLKQALEILLSPRGFQLGPRQITLSTVGHLPGLKRLNELPPVNLALSLHSPFKQQRDQLIPIGERYCILEVLQILKSKKLLKRQFIAFEYLLIQGVNDSQLHAQELGKILKNFTAIFNLIPFNPFPCSPFLPPSRQGVEQFKNWLVEQNIRVMIRKTKGDDILAACGQLYSKEKMPIILPQVNQQYP